MKPMIKHVILSVILTVISVDIVYATTSPSGEPVTGSKAVPGTVLWQRTLAGKAHEGATDSDGNSYFSIDMGLLALNKDGTQKWFYESGDTPYGTPSINKKTGSVRFFADDFKVHSISKDGELEFSSDLPFNAQCTVNAYWAQSTAVGSDGTTYIGVRPGLVAYDNAGTVKWMFRQSKNSWHYFYAPVIDARDVIYSKSDDGYLYAVNPDGTQKWKKKLGDKYNEGMAAVGVNGVVYAYSDYKKALLAIDGKGNDLWRFSVKGESLSSIDPPAVGKSGIIYIASSSGKLYAINQDGTMRWVAKKNDEQFTGKPVVTSDGDILVNGIRGIYRINPKGIVASGIPIQAIDNQRISMPVTSPDSSVLFSASVKQGNKIFNKILSYTKESIPNWSVTPRGTHIYYSPTITTNGDVVVMPNIYEPITWFNKFGAVKSRFLASGVEEPVAGGIAEVILGENYDVVKLFATGKKQILFDGEGGFYYHPSIDSRGNVYFYLYGGYVGAKNSIIKVNACGGKEWELSDVIPDDPGSYGGDVTPAIGRDDTVYFASIDFVYAYSPDGTQKWKTGMESIWASPVILGKNDLVIVPNILESGDSYQLWIKAYQPMDGSRKWDFLVATTTDAWNAWGTVTVVGEDGTVYVNSPGNNVLMALNGKDGSLLWQQQGRFAGSPVIGNAGVVYVVTQSKGVIKALNGKTGRSLWSKKLGEDVYASPIMGNDGTLYIGSRKGKIIALASGSDRPAQNGWPMYRHDGGQTSNAGWNGDNLNISCEGNKQETSASWLSGGHSETQSQPLDAFSHLIERSKYVHWPHAVDRPVILDRFKTPSGAFQPRVP